MKTIVAMMLGSLICSGQTGTSSIQGTIMDGKTQKPIPTAIVRAIRGGVPAFARNTRSGADGSFSIRSLAPGMYSVCVQVETAQYLDPCRWNGSPIKISLSAAQAVNGTQVKLNPASVLNIQVIDNQDSLRQKTNDGRTPELTLGVWGPKGIFYPAINIGRGVSSASVQGKPAAAVPPQTYLYRLVVPLDTPLNFHASSQDLKLADTAGSPLPASANSQAYQQLFQHSTGDPAPKSFALSVTGLAK